MTNHAELRETIRTSHGAGFVRAAEYLLTLPDDASVIDAVIAEGWTRSAVQGTRYADSIYTAVRRYLNGLTDFPYTQFNLEMLARENAAKAATGRFVPEAFLTSFGHLPNASNSPRC